MVEPTDLPIVNNIGRHLWPRLRSQGMPGHMKPRPDQELLPLSHRSPSPILPQAHIILDCPYKKGIVPSSDMQGGNLDTGIILVDAPLPPKFIIGGML